MQMWYCLCDIMHVWTSSYERETIDVDEIVIEFY
jgi:hypothetical protein